LVLDAENTTERQLRAYVYLGSVDLKLKNDPEGSSTFTVTPSLKIFGITPAAWVSPSWDLKILPASSPGELPLSAGRADVVAVPAQDGIGLGSKSLVLRKTDIDSLKERTTRIGLFGRIRYNDVFGKMRWTNFCLLYDWDGANANNAETCAEHNDADWSGPPPPIVMPLTIRITTSPQKPH
jgi:hypothetical protein